MLETDTVILESPLPLVSLIIPAYNVEKYLERAVASALTQTYQNLEIIIVDDGSTDSTGALCGKLAQQDGRISVIHQRNQGLSVARNNGIEAAKGSFLAFLDSDDYLGPDHIKNLYSALIQTNARLAITGPTFVEENNQQNASCNTINPSCIKTLEAENAACIACESTSLPFAEHAWGKLYSAELKHLLYFPPEKYWEDQFVTYKVILADEKVAYEDANDYYYLQRNGSLSRAYNEHIFDTLEARDCMLAHATENHLKQLEECVTKKYFARLVSLYIELNANEQGELTEKAYQTILQRRKEGLASPFVANTTKAALLLSFLPKKIFSGLLRFCVFLGRLGPIQAIRGAL